MIRSKRTLVALGWLVLGAAGAQAQFGGGFGGGIASGIGFGAGMGGGGMGGGYGYNPGPVGGYMQGLASVTNANGEYQMQIQQARVEQQQAEKARNSTRIDWDKTRLEETSLRSQQMTANKDFRENVRTQARLETLNWSRDNPPPHYIMEAVALNAIANEVKRIQLDSNLRGPQILVDPEVLSHINTTDGGRASGGASLKAINSNGSLKWPIIMRSRDFEPIRKSLDQQMAGAIRMVKSDSMDAETYNKMTVEVENLQKYLDGQVSDLRPDDFIRANRFVTDLQQDVSLFGRDDAKKYFTGDFKAQGSTVGEVLENMFKSGMTFAAGAESDRQYYFSFYNSLQQYDAALQQLSGPPNPLVAPDNSPTIPIRP